MDIPDWFIWITLGLAVLQAIGLIPVVRRIGGADPAARSEARQHLLEAVGSLLVFGSLLLSRTVAESWSWIALAGFALMTAVYVAKGARKLRARLPMRGKRGRT
ncbi:hypothetical protein ACWD5B_10145 [Streptomyces tanashiensis]|uniref:hypothetical protein n=1 Tax=Streptomyces tanashiensis TaxID=67367 RepID=UPI0036996942